MNYESQEEYEHYEGAMEQSVPQEEPPQNKSNDAVFEYGQMFIFRDTKTGKLPSECLSFKYSIHAETPLIFIKDNKDGTFMYSSKSGQHTRDIQALQYCEFIKDQQCEEKVREAVEEERKKYRETNFKSLKAQMYEDLEEYGDMHDDDCACNTEGECDCETMQWAKMRCEEWMGRVNQMWVEHLMEHRKHCSTRDGNKDLTKRKHKIFAPITNNNRRL